MDWYYTAGTERKGPMDEATLRAMIASGEIARDALLWNPILPDWIPCSQIAPSPVAEAAPVAAPLAATRFQRAYFIVLLFGSTLGIVVRVFPALAMVLSVWVSRPLFFIGLALAGLALWEQSGRASLPLRLCVVVPFTLGLLSFGFGWILFRDPVVFSEGPPLWLSAYLVFGLVVMGVDVLCAVAGLRMLRT